MDSIAASRGKVTKLLCPSCEGSGTFLDIGTIKIPCQWCGGTKRVKVDAAVRYAEWTYTIGIGGYVTGDHDWEDRERFVAKAERVYELLGKTPSWKQTSTA